MKIRRKSEAQETEKRVKGASRPAVNSAKRSIFIVVLAIIAAGLIFWVWNIGKKAEQTVTVAMWSQNVYKNQVITTDLMEPYEMLLGEYEKLAITNNNNGTQTKRVVLWADAQQLVGAFAAYPLQAGNYVEYRTLIKSRVDNSDSVLYSFPGKDIVKLDVGSGELTAFKTFLQPGDRLNIIAIYQDSIEVESTDAYGNKITESKDVYRSETIFGDIMVADMLNQAGDSILDIYAEYNDMTVWQQSQLDNDSDFKSRTEPASLLVALTPEEQERYYYYLSKSNVEFKVSMPQRMD